MTVAEYEKELELFRKHKDVLCRKRNPLIGIYQYHFITRADDVCNFKISDPKGHDKFPFCLSQRERWSKNARDSRNCPNQVLLASVNGLQELHLCCIGNLARVSTETQPRSWLYDDGKASRTQRFQRGKDQIHQEYHQDIQEQTGVGHLPKQ